MFMRSIFFIIIFSFFSHTVSASEAVSSSSRVEQDNSVLSSELTRESVANVLSSLSDKEVRELLKKQLNGLADKQLNEKEVSSNSPNFSDGIDNLRKAFVNNFHQTIALPETFNKIKEHFSQGRTGYLFPFIVKLLVCFTFAFLLDLMSAKLLRFKISVTLAGQLPTLINKLKVLIKLLLVRLLNLCVFFLSASLFIPLSFENNIEVLTAKAILVFVFTARFTFLLAALVLAPKDSTLRLYNLKDKQAKTLTNRLIILSLISVADVFQKWTKNLGLDPTEHQIGFWINFSFYIAIIWLVWRSRFIFQEMLLNGRNRVSNAQMRLIKLWPGLVAMLSILVWFTLEYILANGGLKQHYVDAAAFSVVFINFIPFINVAIFSTVERLLPINNELSDRQVNFQYEVQDNVIKASQLFFVCISLFGLATIWGINFYGEGVYQPSHALFVRAIEFLSVPVIAYVCWLSVDTYVAYKLASENPFDEEHQEDTEGGVGLSRMATVLPLLRITAAFIIVVVAFFGVFASLGINTTPLLAGASVVGLAVGFGAQTLVKDIVSGLFFLVDDAFRMGEYVDVGGVKGTVERIALRSLRLRHHLGPQHTIPYGEISKLTNYSRDWVIMKLRFRVPHDTDVNKVKKLFKKLGKELLDHPELGKDFLAPFKSQGVLEVDEVGMLIRGKFTAKPGSQFMIRKEIYVRVQQVFAENNIEFAKRKVEVQIPDYVPSDIKHSISAGASTALQEGSEQSNK